MNPNATKHRVFAKVANRTYTPTETVEIKPDEKVVPIGAPTFIGLDLAPDWREQFSGETFSSVAEHAESLTVGSGNPPGYPEWMQAAFSRGTRQSSFAETHEQAPARETDYIDNRPLPTASDLEGLEYALAVEQATVPVAEPVSLLALSLASGGVVGSPDPPVLVGEQVSDFMLPKAVIVKVHSVQPEPRVCTIGPVEGETFESLVAFQDDATKFLEDALDGLPSRTRVVHYPASAEGEPDMDEVQVVDNIHEKSQGFFYQSIGRGNRIINESSQLTDYEQAAELGTSVHLVRHLKRELALMESRIQLSRTQAVAEALEKVVQVVTSVKFSTLT